MKAYEKKQALEMRKSGASIKEIAKRLGVSKGSVSVWVSDVVLPDEIRDKLFLRGWTTEAIENRRMA